jgi:hypothetical protein
MPIIQMVMGYKNVWLGFHNFHDNEREGKVFLSIQRELALVTTLPMSSLSNYNRIGCNNEHKRKLSYFKLANSTVD